MAHASDDDDGDEVQRLSREVAVLQERTRGLDGMADSLHRIDNRLGRLETDLRVRVALVGGLLAVVMPVVLFVLNKMFRS